MAACTREAAATETACSHFFFLQVSDTALLRRSDNQRLYFRAFVTIVHNMYQMPSVLVGLFFPYPSPGVNSDNILILP